MRNYAYLSENLSEVKNEIAKLEARLGRHVTLVAVTKGGDDDEFLALLGMGAECIGENRPSELCRRLELARRMGYSPVMHQIGHLQSNKVKLAVGNSGLIHSLDSYSLAERISRQAVALGIRQDVLIEINSGREDAKGGVFPEDAEQLFLAARELPGIAVRGLMTMGPAVESEEQARPYFALTKRIFDKFNSQYGFEGEPILSMGMSNTYRTAIEEGATLVRVGRRLFIKDKEN